MTDSKTSEKEACEYAESIINTLREPLIVLDQDLKVISTSRSFYHGFKVSPEETEGQLIYDLGNKQWDIPELRELLEAVLPQKTTLDDYEIEHEFADLGRRAMLLNAREIQRKSGKERIILLAIEDITERKRQENLLSESEERYRRLFETADDGIVLLEKTEGKITHANPAITELSGYNQDELIGKRLINIGFPGDIGNIQETLAALEKDGILHYKDAAVQTKTGQAIDTDIYMVDKAILVQCNIRDIAERKRAEQARRESEEKYRHIFECSPEAIVLLDTEGAVLDVNERLYDWLGYKPDEVKGGKLEHLPFLPRHSKDIARSRFTEIMKGVEAPPYELDFVSRNNEPRIGLVHATPLTDTEGKNIADLVLISDITQRKEAELKLRQTLDELRAAQSKLIEQERRQALSTMASGIAHEFNNQIAIIMGYAEMMKDDASLRQDDETFKQYLKHISTAAYNAGETVRRMRKFYRPREEKAFSEVNLNRIVQDAVSLTEPRWKKEAEAQNKTIHIQTDTAETPPITGDKSELHEMMTNLIFNAVDAMPEGGTIRIETRAKDDDVQLVFSDTGIGMPEEKRRQCTDPFYTTKGTYGTGLGLSAVKGTIDRHNGEMSIESTPGQGTAFTVTFPRAVCENQDAAEETQPENQEKLSLKLLVVEDDEPQRQLLKKLLTGKGLEVDVAREAREGLKYVREREYDILITDRAMPHMSGDQFAAEAKKIHPEIPIIMLTGFGDMMEAAGESVEDADLVISKPFTWKKLREALQHFTG